MLKRMILVVCCVAVAQTGAFTASGQAFPQRLVNGSAESGLAAWRDTTSFGTLPYADDIPRRSYSGEMLFAAPIDGSMRQDVDFSDLAATIDAGQEHFSAGGLLGGRGELLPGAARLVAQPLDGAQAPLGAALVVGPPSERDKQAQTTLLGCFRTASAPVGMRSLRLTIEAIGHGLADDLWVVPVVVDVRPAEGIAKIGFRPVASDGPGCDEHFEPIPAPAVQSLVVMPAVKRCGMGALRFRVDRRWRSSVAKFSVTARGKHVVRKADKPIVLAAPKRTLRVVVTASLKDGRRSSGTQTFSAC